MQDFLNNFKNLVKSEEVRTDNNVFKLHYKFSVILLIVFSILLSSKQYFGEPIACQGDVQKEIMDVFCWVSGTFVILNNLNDWYLQSAGVDGLGNEAGKQTYTLLYYQWICLLFCIQALFFYIPRYLWKSWEGERLGHLVKDLCSPIVSDKIWCAAYKEKMRAYIIYQENHDIFAYRFAFCELLNLLNLLCQCIFMDWYLGGKFSRYGYEVATKPWPVAYNAVFPKRTKCTYTKFGSSGTLENRDAICVLPLNILNEKFFLILWYWMIFMFVVSIGALIYRCMVICCQEFRVYLLMAQVRGMGNKKLKTIARYLSHGQFFLLYNLGKNMNPIVYKELLLSMFEHLNIELR